MLFLFTVSSPRSPRNCWDNAVAERFFLNLKMERVWQRQYANHAEAKADVIDYILGFYNCKRIISALGNLSPVVYERKMAAQPIVVSEITSPPHSASCATDTPGSHACCASLRFNSSG